MNLSSHLMHMKDFILAQSKELASVITNEQNARYPELQRVEQDLFPLRIELVELYGACLGMSEDQRVLVLKEWGGKAGSSTARMKQIAKRDREEAANLVNKSLKVIIKPK